MIRRGFTLHQGIIILIFVAVLVWFWLILKIGDYVDSFGVSASVKEHTNAIKMIEKTPDVTPTSTLVDY